MYPDSALAAWQLALMAVVVVASLVVWLTAVYLAASQPGDRTREAAAAPDQEAVDDQRHPGELAALP